MPLFSQRGKEINKKSDKRIVLVLLGDFQSGHREALMPLDMQLKAEMSGKVEYFPITPTPFQVYVWAVYEKQIARAIEIADGDDLVVFTGGDLCQGVYFPRYLISSRLSDQIQIAMANLQPWLKLKNLKAMRFVKGTGYHEFGEGSAAILINDFVKAKRPDINTETYFHGLINVRGVTVDAAHKGANEGSRKWLSGNNPRLYTQSIMMNDLEFGRRPPDIVWRNHYHQYIRTPVILFWGGVEYETQYVLTPSFQGKDEWTRDAIKNYPILHNGMVAIEIEKGHICRIHPLIEILDLRVHEII